MDYVLNDDFYQISNLNDKKRKFVETSFKNKVSEINHMRQKLLETKENVFNTESNCEEKKKLSQNYMKGIKPRTARPNFRESNKESLASSLNKKKKNKRSSFDKEQCKV